MDRYLKSNDKFTLNGISGEFVIREIVGRGSSCVVYRTDFYNPEGILTEHLVKEYNPKDIALVRNDKGTLVVENESDQAAFEAGLVWFEDGLNKQRELRRGEKLRNYTANIQNTYRDHGTLYVDMTVRSGKNYEGYKEASVYNLMKRMRTLTQVVGHYHAAGYLHLDLKPANIYVRPDDETCEDVLLFDFDSMVKTEDISKGIGLSYTQEWAALEQMVPNRRSKIGAWTDFFAIGEMIFVQLMGRHSESWERCAFAEYDFDFTQPIFANVNPKVKLLLTELLQKTICNTVSRRFQMAEEMIAKLNEIIEIVHPRKQQLIGNCPPVKQVFVGRERELKAIHSILQDHKVLFLTGIGGIGKSELAKGYAQEYANEYDEVIYTAYKGSVMLLVNNDLSVQISNFTQPKNIEQPSYFKNKIEKLAELCTERTLFIIDDLNSYEFTESDKARWTDLLKLKCKFLITTRMRETIHSSLRIEAIASPEEKVHLFDEWCRIEDDEQYAAVQKIIELVNGHTFTIELIAKQTYAGFSTPIEKLNTLLRNGINNSGNEQVEAEKDLYQTQGRVIDHICLLFDIAQLDDAKQHVLKNMALLPFDGMDAKLFANLCAWGDNDALADWHTSEVTLNDGTVLTPARVIAEISWLVRTGWINREGNNISVHPVVAESILTKLLSIEDCSPYLAGVSNCLEEWETYSYKVKIQLMDCAQALISYFNRSTWSSETVAVVLKTIGKFYYKKLYILNESLTALRLSERKLLDSPCEDEELRISIKNGIAVLYDSIASVTGDNEQRNYAIEAYKECLALYDLIDADQLAVATVWQNLACAYDNNGLFDLSESAFEKALEILHSIARSQGQTEAVVSEIITTYTNYAIHYKKIACYYDALESLNTAMGYAALVDKKTERFAKICHDIASIILLLPDGDIDRAVKYAKQSLIIREEIHLPESYFIAMSKFVLARCYIKQGLPANISKAKALLNEAKPVLIKTLGKPNKDVQALLGLLNTVQ